MDQHLVPLPVSEPISESTSQISRLRGGARSKRTLAGTILSEEDSDQSCSSSSSSDSSSYDGYDSRGNPRREEATNPSEHSSEIDENDEWFAEHDGYDSSGNPRVDNPRVDVDLTILPDVVMEDATN